jgi:acetyl esterase/lipase
MLDRARKDRISPPLGRFGLGLLAAALLAIGCFAVARAQYSRLSPTYDDQHASQKVDVYLAQTTEPVPCMIYIHGGGWTAGSKQRLPDWLMAGIEERVFSVVSVEYRFSTVAPHPAQVNDCLRAVQFVRLHADEWKLDAKRIGVTGGSAGGHLSLWVALHDDIADPSSSNELLKQSSRVSCAVSFAGPTDWSLLKTIPHKHPAYRTLIGMKRDMPFDNIDAEQLRDVSPITFVSSDDPPILLIHGDQDDIVPIEHSRNIDRKLQAEGVRSEQVTIRGGDHSVAAAAPPVCVRATAFVREVFNLKRETAARSSF